MIDGIRSACLLRSNKRVIQDKKFTPRSSDTGTDANPACAGLSEDPGALACSGQAPAISGESDALESLTRITGRTQCASVAEAAHLLLLSDSSRAALVPGEAVLPPGLRRAPPNGAWFV